MSWTLSVDVKKKKTCLPQRKQISLLWGFDIFRSVSLLQIFVGSDSYLSNYETAALLEPTAQEADVDSSFCKDSSG